MCGIAGYVGNRAAEKIKLMCDAMLHRGPDAEGIFCDEDMRLVLGHRRLHVLDLSETGDQPMTSQDGRYVIVYNGEIYNHQELRRETQKVFPSLQYKGSSDTESILEAISILGLEKALDLSIGMFAFCIYDKLEKTLRLARDRAGEKPLYYGTYQDAFFFMSDLNSLHAIGIRPSIDREALRLYCNYGYYPAPYTVFEGVYKLRPGHMMMLRPPYTTHEETPYWDAYAAARNAMENPFRGSIEEAVGELGTLLRQSIKGQMMSDVPLGAFLSGGVDSSLVVSVMRELSEEKIKTFSIGFEEDQFNEAVYAKAVARHLETDHTEWYVTARDAMDVIPRIPEIYAEPFADSSQIPTYLVSRLAKQKVTVSLSGDAGDELFGGYNAYKALSMAEKIPLRGVLGKAAMWLSSTPTAYLCNRDVLYRGGRLLAAKNYAQACRALRGFWQEMPVVLGVQNTYTCAIEDPAGCPVQNHVEQFMMNIDFRMCLPDDMLVKVDRAAMAVSLETRVPLLDKRVIEFAWSLPLNYKIHDGVRKWPLRQLLYRYVPKELIERPKQGFGIPVHAWLSGPLRDWAEDLLDEKRLREQGYLDAVVVRRGWRHFLSNKKDTGRAIWFILMFQSWMERNRNTQASHNDARITFGAS